jgi:hypothetical protein
MAAKAPYHYLLIGPTISGAILAPASLLIGIQTSADNGGSQGWEVVAVVSAIFGAFVGALAGACLVAGTTAAFPIMKKLNTNNTGVAIAVSTLLATAGFGSVSLWILSHFDGSGRGYHTQWGFAFIYPLTFVVYFPFAYAFWVTRRPDHDARS